MASHSYNFIHILAIDLPIRENSPERTSVIKYLVDRFSATFVVNYNEFCMRSILIILYMCIGEFIISIKALIVFGKSILC